jgi:hypothetical protein
MGAGVEYYHVDYVRLRQTFYGQNFDTSPLIPLPVRGGEEKLAEGRTELEQKGTKQTEAFSFSDP